MVAQADRHQGRAATKPPTAVKAELPWLSRTPARRDRRGTARGAARQRRSRRVRLGLDAPMFIALAMIVVIAIMIWKKVPGRDRQGARQQDRG